MPTVAKPAKAEKPSVSASHVRISLLDRLFLAIDGIYHFLASLKLAVISLGTLAAVLGYATFYESWYGTAAVQEDVYKSPTFAVLLAFLGANILCAALIRYPWTRRQTGFVITHTGLLTVLVGSFLTLKMADEGQVGLAEGERSAQLVRTDYSVIRVRPLDDQNRATQEYQIPFRPGTMNWNPDHPDLTRSLTHAVFHPSLGRISSAFQGMANLVAPALVSWKPDRSEVLTTSEDPFQLVATNYFPASMGRTIREPAPQGHDHGVPMLRVRPRFKAPGMTEATELFETEDDQWFVARNKFFRAVRDVGPAQFAFQFVTGPSILEDFLTTPKDAPPNGLARLHYTDKSGKPRVHPWPIDGVSKEETLPESDLKVRFVKTLEIPTQSTGLDEMTGEGVIPAVQFQITQANGPALDHYGWASLPMVPSFIPGSVPGGKELARVDYYKVPSGGRFGLIEVMADTEGRMAYRVHDRKGLRSVGPISRNEDVQAFGGSANDPMSMTIRITDFLANGEERSDFVPLALPKDKLNQGIPAAKVAMTVDGDTQTAWIRKSPGLDPLPPVTLTFKDGKSFEVMFDSDRKDLPFSVALDDFEVGFDPGTMQASAYTSQVRLTDEPRKVLNKPVTITMNEPMKHLAWTFYQASYDRVRDATTGRETGAYKSIFQVRLDPVWGVTYAGCLIVVLGAFVQFYMRAGVFTAGGTAKFQQKLAGKSHNPSVANTDQVL